MTDAFSPAWTVTKPGLESRGGIVVAQNAKAARVGADVLAAGGNAVDAAIATSLALAATEPWMSGLGGGGCMLVAPGDGGPVRAFDFAMVAPAGLDASAYPLTGSAGPDLFGWPGVVEDRNIQGPLAICVPGQVAGLALAHARLASMPWAELVEPARRLAAEGLEIDWFAALAITNAAAGLAAFPASRAAWLPGGFPPALDYAGAARHLPLGRLADTLATLAAEGADAFYRGGIGAALVEGLAAMGCPLARGDLEAYAAREVAPLAIHYRGADLRAMPGLFAGPTFARCLELLTPRDLGAMPGPAAYLAWAETLRAAYAERLAGMGAAAPPSCTSHLCVVDRAGTIVSLTQTLLSLFGSRVVSPATGILLNNGIMWFDPRPGAPNSIRAGARPLTNMCPVVGATGDGRRLGLGASGGRRILPAVLQLASLVVDFGLTLDAAFHTARLDASGGPEVVVSPAVPTEALRELAARFPTRVARATVYPTLYACPTGVLRDPGGMNHGAAEPIVPWAGPIAAG
jgi:gamma-glutamyltranspeptidase/glutathione hydrolase